ncbi:hypothetical protein FQR65_LT03071 [Abscondita terminalis]|nr:hypothetical protein FQR65_LT03071 [Abscondita terminalis]
MDDSLQSELNANDEGTEEELLESDNNDEVYKYVNDKEKEEKVKEVELEVIESIKDIEEQEHLSIFKKLDASRVLLDRFDLTLDHVKQIQNELGIITLCWPDIENPEFENRVDFPESYVKNSNKEKLLLLYTENFRQEFSKLHPGRNPCYFACRNEVGILKMVCTTLRPTSLPYPEIEDWKDCASFVGDYFIYEPLEAPTLLPTRLCSPHTVFLRRTGHSFELATALCSILLGHGYDAYVVSGYATQDVCLKIMIRVESPFPINKEKEEIVVKTEDTKKYMLKPLKCLTSKYLQAMAQRETDKIQEEKDRINQLEQKKMEELEKPLFDEIYGQRVHAWVLIQSGTKNIEKSIFVEPTTGVCYDTDSDDYCGIESVWNNINYWVNLQDCSKGLGKIDFDLTNLRNWEHILLGEPFTLRDYEFSKNIDEDETKRLQISNEKHLDMPASWSKKIYIPHYVLKQRFPSGVKKTWYKRTFVEQYAPFVQEDGLIIKIFRYHDLVYSPSELYAIEEHYENRVDKLMKINNNWVNGDIVEIFSSGREDCLKKHIYKRGDKVSVELPRVLEFYHLARHDGLAKVILDPLYITEYYQNTKNGIYYRHTNFAPREQAPPGMIAGVRRLVIKIVEKFKRNKKIPAAEDISVREFAIAEGEIHLKFQYEEGRVTASTRDFIKPPLSEVTESLSFKPEQTVGYQAESGAKPPRQLQLFYLFDKQLREEEKTLKHLRELEDQVLEILNQRCIDKAFPSLQVSFFDKEHNEKNVQGMKEREQQEKEHREREVEDEVDYLTPYIARLGKLKVVLSRSEAQHVRECCLKEFKQILLDRAINIQTQFDSLSAQLEIKQQSHSIVQDTLSFNEQNQYLEEVNVIQCLMRALEIRLARHKDLSPFRFEILENYLNGHPKLTELND